VPSESSPPLQPARLPSIKSSGIRLVPKDQPVRKDPQDPPVHKEQREPPAPKAPQDLLDLPGRKDPRECR